MKNTEFYNCLMTDNQLRQLIKTTHVFKIDKCSLQYLNRLKIPLILLHNSPIQPPQNRLEYFPMHFEEQSSNTMRVVAMKSPITLPSDVQD